jgi:hypothetical protein
MKRAKLAGDSVTLPTGIAATVTVEDPLFPSAVAVIVAVPRRRPSRLRMTTQSPSTRYSFPT